METLSKFIMKTDPSSLRKRLKALNYPSNFSEDSAPLIDRLLGDLIKASEAYQSAKKSSSEKPSESFAESDLKKIIKSLERENNEVHSVLIAKEAIIAEQLLLVRKLQLEAKSSSDVAGSGKSAQFSEFESMRQEAKAAFESEIASLKVEILRLRKLCEGSSGSLVVRHAKVEEENKRANSDILHSQLEYLSKVNEQLKVDLAKANAKLPQLKKDLDAQTASKEAEVSKLKEELENLKKLALKKEDSVWSNAAEKVQQELFATQERLLGSENQRLELQANLTLCESKVAALKKDNEELRLLSSETEKRNLELWKRQQHTEENMINIKSNINSDAVQLRMLQTQLDDQTSKFDQLKKQFDEQSQKIPILTSKATEAELLAGRLSSEKNMLEGLLDQKQQAELLLRKKLTDLQTSYDKLAVEKISSDCLTKESSTLAEKMHQKIIESEQISAQLRAAQERNFALSSEVVELRDKEKLLSSKLDIIEEKKNQLLDQLSAANKKATDLEERVRTVMLSEKTAQLELESLRRNFKAEENAKVGEIEIIKVQAELDSAKQREKFLTEELFETKNLLVKKDNEAFELRSKVNELTKEVEAAASQHRLEQEARHEHAKRFENLNEKYEMSAQASEELASALAASQKSLFELQSSVQEKDKEISNQASRILSLNEEVRNLKQKLSSFIDKESSTNAIINELKDSLENNEKKNLSMAAQLELHIRCIKQLESSSALKENQLESLKSEQAVISDLLSRAQASPPVIHVATDQLYREKELREEIKKLSEKVERLEAEKLDFKRKLARLDSERDEIAAALEARVSDSEDAKSKTILQERTIAELREQLGELHRQKTQVFYQAEESVGVIESLTQENIRIMEELKNYKARLAKVEAERAELASDVQILAGESNMLTNEALLSNKRREAVERKLQEKTERVRVLELDLASANIERNQLSNACHEKESSLAGMKLTLGKLQGGADSSSIQLRKMEQEKAELRRQMIEAERSCSQIAAELAALKLEWGKMTLELQSEKVLRAESESELRLIQAREENLQNSVGRLQKSLAEKEAHSKVLADEMASLQQLYQQMKAKNENLAEKYISQIRSGELDKMHSQAKSEKWSGRY